VRAPTGSGKTLAYLLPIAHALARLPPADLSTPGRPNAIVFLPTRELAAQVHEHAERHVAAAGFPCALVVGGADEKSQLAAVRANARCVIGTPGRIKEFVDRGVIKTDGVIAQVLDEADRLLDGGFERDVESVMTPPGGAARTMCLSATMPQSLARFLQRQLPPDHAVIDMFGKGGGNVGGSVEHLAVTTRPIDLVGVVLDAIDAYASGGGQSHRGDIDDGQSQRATGQTIVFVETKAFAEQLSGTLAIAYEVRGTLG
jgi:superfamily II DNA/RNA helicase